MIQLFTTKIGWLRLIGFLEGVSLLVLIFIAVPMKHIYHNPALSTFLGPVHGSMFVLYVLQTLSVSIEQNWSFKTTTWKILVACLIPFGTFYINHKLFRYMKE